MAQTLKQNAVDTNPATDRSKAGARPGPVPGKVTTPQPGDGRNGNPAPAPAPGPSTGAGPDGKGDVEGPSTTDALERRNESMNRAGIAGGRNSSE